MKGYISSRDYAEKYGINATNVTHKCEKGLIHGAIKEKNRWYIPEDAENVDGRTKAAIDRKRAGEPPRIDRITSRQYATDEEMAVAMATVDVSKGDVRSLAQIKLYLEKAQAWAALVESRPELADSIQAVIDSISE